MPWNNQGGGGPWGGGGGGSNNPWGRGGGGFGGNRPPDLEELLRKSQDRFRRVLPGGVFGSGRGLLLVVLAVLLVWVAFGI
jgi:membrane protease subunit HflK